MPESFEWLVLSSGLIEGKDIENMLEEPEKYIDSKEYFIWGKVLYKSPCRSDAGQLSAV